MENNILLSIRNISKRFGGTQALDNVSFDVKRGEIHALLGENGAGKSTLIKIISGVVAKDSGEVLVEGETLHIKNAQQARGAGINVVYQELSLVPGLSVAENICASNEKMNTFKMMKLNDLGDDVLSILKMLKIDAKTPVRALGIGAQQMVEIAGAISRNCRILILDEPTASLTNDEIKELYKIMSMMKENGVTIIFISHKLSEVFDIADRATVMKDGRFVATANVAELDEKKIVEMMTGRDLTDMYPPKAENIGQTVLAVEQYTGSGFQDISFELHEGEILGLAGLTGAGRTELCTTIFGVQKSYGGTIKLFGETFKPTKVTDAMKAGIGYLPEDRKEAGAFMQMSIKENTIAATLDKISRYGLIHQNLAENNTTKMIEKLNTKVGSINAKILSLSGGNQQKIILSRWLLQNPRILIVDEPTRGIDVGAKFEIYQILRDLANHGMAIIIISSELPEIIGMSDRIATFYKGSISNMIDSSDQYLREKIGSGIMGIDYNSSSKGA
ncbi:MAG TPA: sugar ABC transporter ATP-binding protein [Anaerovoracaceae bacterium]|nr:sugar ABC transporter ATP-binding protein [Anaerovoracaceae bacterium]